MHDSIHACITFMRTVYKWGLSCIDGMFFFSGFLE